VGPFLNGLHFFFGVGSFLAPAMVAQAFARGVGLQWVYWTIASLLALVAIVVVALPSPARRLASTAREGPPPRDRVLVILVMASLAAYAGVELGFGGWVFTYATDRRSMAPASAAYLTSMYWGAFMLGRLVSIPVMSSLARRDEGRPGRSGGGTSCRILEIALASSAVALAILLWSNGERSLWIGTAVLGFSIGPIFPTLFTVAEQRLKLSGRITSFFLVGAGLGAMVIPWAMGLAMHRFGTGVLLPSVGACLGLLLAFYRAMTPSLYAVSLKPH
jgi:fucose permease